MCFVVQRFYNLPVFGPNESSGRASSKLHTLTDLKRETRRSHSQTTQQDKMQGILAANNEAAQVLIVQGGYEEAIELLEDATVHLTNPDIKSAEEPGTANQSSRFSPVRLNEDSSVDTAMNPFSIFARPFCATLQPPHQQGELS